MTFQFNPESLTVSTSGKGGSDIAMEELTLETEGLQTDDTTQSSGVGEVVIMFRKDTGESETDDAYFVRTDGTTTTPSLDDGGTDPGSTQINQTDLAFL